MGTIERHGRTVRLVLTRFQSTDGKKHGAGTVIDGWQYEVFATGLRADHWPASEVATLYYGRCGEENDFAREDALLKLDHIVSFNLAGQRLFNLLGLWLWNLRILHGAQHVGGLQPLPHVQEPRYVITEQPRPVSEEDASSGTDNDLRTNADELVEHTSSPNLEKLDQQGKQTAAVIDQTNQQLVAVFQSRFKEKDWSFVPATWSICCPVGHDLQLYQFRVVADATVEARFVGLVSQCRDCSQRTECSSSLKPNFAKEITAYVHLSSELHSSLSKALAVKRKTQAALGNRRLRKISASHLHKAVAPGPLEMQQPFLVPAVLVNMLLDYTRDLLIHIRVKTGPVPPSDPRYYARTDAERQRRRKTWAQRMLWNALPENSTVIADIATSVLNEKHDEVAYAA